MKKDTYYFSHDATAKDDPKCMLLIDQLGLEGYGIFWILVETLRAQPDYKCPMNVVSALAKRYSSSQEKITTVIKSFGLFKIEQDEIFFSESLLRRMLQSDAIRERLSSAGKRGYLIKTGQFKPIQATLKPPLSHPQALNQSKSNQSKEKILGLLKEKNVSFGVKYIEWIDFRKEKKKPVSFGAAKKQIDFLLLHSEDADKIIDQSIMNDWQGLFEFKGGVNKTQVHSPHHIGKMDYANSKL